MLATVARRRRGRERMSELARSGTVADHRDAMVEAGRDRAGDAPVCASSAQWSCACSHAPRYLRARRFRGRRRMAMPGAGQPPGGFQPSPSFLRLGLQEGGENGAGDAQPQVRSDRNRSVGTRDRQSRRAAAQRVHRPGRDESGERGFGDDLVTAVVRELLTKGGAQPRPRRSGRSRARPPPGLPGQTGDDLTDRIEEITGRHVSPSSAPTTSTPTGRRAICGPLARSGIRASELCDLRVGEVRVHDRECVGCEPPPAEGPWRGGGDKAACARSLQRRPIASQRAARARQRDHSIALPTTWVVARIRGEDPVIACVRPPGEP